MTNWHILITVSPLLLLSCQTRQLEQIPTSDSKIPHSWSTKIKELSSDNNQTFWAESFNIQRLTELITLAQKKNPDLISLTELTIATGEGATIAGTKLMPIVNAELTGSRTKRNLIGFNFPDSSTSFTTNSFSSGINVSWELDLWGKIKDSHSSSLKRFNATLADLSAARLSLSGQVAKTWFAGLENSLQIKLTQKTVNTYAQNRSFINERYRKGLATALEQKLAEASYQSSLSILAQRERRRNQLAQSLQLFTGEYPSGELDFNASENLPDLRLPQLPPIPSKVVQSRHDLTSAFMTLEAAGLDLKIAKKNLLPSFTLIGGPGSRAESIKDLLDEKYRVWDISGGISQPIFQAGRLKAGIRKAKAMQNSALANLKTLTLRAFSEVEDSLNSDILLEEEENSLETASQALSKAAEICWERYQKGVIEIFDTLDTQRRSFDAQSRLLQLKKVRVFNRINLYLAIGMNAIPNES
ncbi:MAG: TolC family protein [Opitutae bacterium]|nr:TolC family protein [Opitutae bacterium]